MCPFECLALVLELDDIGSAVNLAQLGFLDLARCVTRNISVDVLARTLVARQCLTILLKLALM